MSEDHDECLAALAAVREDYDRASLTLFVAGVVAGVVLSGLADVLAWAFAQLAK